MTTFLLSIYSENDSEEVMHVLNNLTERKLIALTLPACIPIGYGYKQTFEIIDESELSPNVQNKEQKLRSTYAVTNNPFS